jgi:hypothetical protein
MRGGLLFILLAAMPYHSLAADNTDILDIPASEYSGDGAEPQADAPAYNEPERKPFKNSGASANIPTAPENPPAENTPAEPAPENIPESNVVVLRGLDKVVGRVSTLEVPIGTLARFENLEIIARKCWKSRPEDQPENAALLEIREVKAGEPPKQLFLGWMFSSSPAISSLEHPVYDITVLSCEYHKELENIEPDKKPETDKNPEPAKAKKKPGKKK